MAVIQIEDPAGHRHVWLIPPGDGPVAPENCQSLLTMLEQLDHIALLCPPVEERALAEALSLPFDALIELPNSNGVLVAGSLRQPGPSRLHVSVSNETARTLPLAPLLIRTVLERAGEPGADPCDMETALHEAITNAVIHGNLGLSSIHAGGQDGLDQYIQTVEQRAAQETLKRRRVTIGVDWDDQQIGFSISDDGDGFNPQTKRTADSATAFSGRGFFLIRSLVSRLEVSDDGKVTSFWFHRLRPS